MVVQFHPKTVISHIIRLFIAREDRTNPTILAKTKPMLALTMGRSGPMSLRTPSKASSFDSYFRLRAAIAGPAPGLRGAADAWFCDLSAWVGRRHDGGFHRACDQLLDDL